MILIILLIIFGLLIFLYYSTNPTETLFYTTTDYPELKPIEDNWEIIKSEIPIFDLNKIDHYTSFTRDRNAWNNNQGDQLFEKINTMDSWINGWMGDQTWFQFPLIYHGKITDSAKQLCPKTTNLLSLPNLRSIRIAGYSILLPKSELPVHNDATGKNSNSMACNMALICPEANLYIESDTGTWEKKSHQDGHMIIFDSNKQHYADNSTDSIRVILYIDFRTDTLYGHSEESQIILDKYYIPGQYMAKSDFGEVIIQIFDSGTTAVCYFKGITPDIEEYYFWNKFGITEQTYKDFVELFKKPKNFSQ